MSTLKPKEAAAELQAVARTFKAVIAVGEMLEAVGSIETLEKEANKRRVAAENACASLQAEASKAKEELALLKSEAEKAKARAANIIADAQAAADELLANAQTAAVKVANTAQEELQDIHAQIKAANAKLNVINATVEKKQSEHAALEKQIESTKDKLRALVG